MIGAEMVYGVTQEMALTLGDLLIRRTHLAFESPDQARALSPIVTDLVAPVLQWTRHDRTTAVREYDGEATRIFGVGSHTG